MSRGSSLNFVRDRDKLEWADERNSLDHSRKEAMYSAVRDTHNSSAFRSCDKISVNINPDMQSVSHVYVIYEKKRYLSLSLSLLQWTQNQSHWDLHGKSNILHRIVVEFIVIIVLYLVMSYMLRIENIYIFPINVQLNIFSPIFFLNIA